MACILVAPTASQRQGNICCPLADQSLLLRTEIVQCHVEIRHRDEHVVSPLRLAFIMRSESTSYTCSLHQRGSGHRRLG